MGIRFNNNSHIGYQLSQQQKPGQQLAGLYHAYLQIPKETRDKLWSKIFDEEETAEERQWRDPRFLRKKAKELGRQAMDDLNTIPMSPKPSERPTITMSQSDETGHENPPNQWLTDLSPYGDNLDLFMLGLNDIPLDYGGYRQNAEDEMNAVQYFPATEEGIVDEPVLDEKAGLQNGLTPEENVRLNHDNINSRMGKWAFDPGTLLDLNLRGYDNGES